MAIMNKESKDLVKCNNIAINLNMIAITIRKTINEINEFIHSRKE